jgi:hypothetical protein
MSVSRREAQAAIALTYGMVAMIEDAVGAVLAAWPTTRWSCLPAITAI